MKINESAPSHRLSLSILLAVSGVLAGCSGSSEDVRITLCKNLTQATQSDAASIEWIGNENTFRRPEYAIAGLSFEVVDAGGKRSAMSSACHYAYEAIEDTAQHLADPFSAYANLPFAMTVDGRPLGDAELLRLVNEEQKRLGREAVKTLEKGARDVVEKVKAGIGS